MTNDFIVSTTEILLVDESRFLDEGGETLQFGPLEGDRVHLHAIGSPAAICYLARSIIDHHTAA